MSKERGKVMREDNWSKRQFFKFFHLLHSKCRAVSPSLFFKEDLAPLERRTVTTVLTLLFANSKTIFIY